MIRIGLPSGKGTMIFKPQDDITPLELAEIVAMFFNANGGYGDYDLLSNEAKRHFQPEPPPEPVKRHD